ncbi:transcriptional regulator [Mycolicibacterium novocastrense]|uniref:Helix-turn-helix domain-containing protein n=1 Tax=Mycolicibacterium novocastrense TaxID=59813 RepID=A0AAW5SHY5_MYCNV|nr:helix-turn-helix domain-containing protein [Mycolicibacterium novocastrense]KUH66377.1 transcriptional regulator [Mycolicibacterium novocastrense]KUH72731.1 transcriptional regulator [Mycolicibacterium novocastrense]KUH74970.1 transcriptional regulator [Mycolicibacterium novocastrense]MCV7022986.1 helix-turn-helix domain-containing protein [Mycolicibacterium novocastrense]GAT10922.1 transcriptional regulator [Mycolicibacterium novocastrense]
MTRRDEVLTALRAAGTPLSVLDVAERLSIHPNTARFHLEALLERGRVEMIKPSRTKPGRPPLMFRATTGMDPDGPRDYRVLAGVLADALARQRDPQRRAVAAGRAWAKKEADGAEQPIDRDQAFERLTNLLDAMGFAPQERSRNDDLDEIGLHNCPFLELADTRRDIICPVHLGLMQGALTAWDAPITVDALTPFAEPGLCIAHMAPRRRVQ